MKLLSEAVYVDYPFSDSTTKSETRFSVHKLDSGKFQLSAQNLGSNSDGLRSDGTPCGTSRWRAKTIEELVPLCASSGSFFTDLTMHTIRNVVYDADDAEYASHADERAEHAKDVERLHTLADRLYPYTNK